MRNFTSDIPLVSVVTAVFNGGPTLAESIGSIQTQTLEKIELLIVDDGSTDSSRGVLDALAADDPRIRVLHRRHRGLTLSLIDGCAEARAPFIARHDAGDRSLPRRLEKQLAAARAEPRASLISCPIRLVDAEGELLHAVSAAVNGPEDPLVSVHPSTLCGPYHGSTMFQRDLYESVGGYRREFSVTQDLDLWVRLAERGKHLVVPEILYEALVSPDSISGLRRADQARSREAIVSSARLRRQGKSDQPVLDALQHDLATRRNLPERTRRAATYYFMGAALRKRNPKKARSYFRSALLLNPFHLRSWLRLMGSWLG